MSAQWRRVEMSGPPEPEEAPLGSLRGFMLEVILGTVAFGMLIPAAVPLRTCGATRSSRLEFERRRAVLEADAAEAEAAETDAAEAQSPAADDLEAGDDEDPDGPRHE